mmetsp:Transcript_28425/g.96729  ORF Transcript_28425/g.96729 Transcript_28425/m.96729 type:complete len:223 (-) Transcript_28425:1600-2268(-)
MIQELWTALEEWSAYGVEVPFVQEDGVVVAQYYVPFLSAVQAYKYDSSAPGERSLLTTFCERDAPYCRAPLHEKTAELGGRSTGFDKLCEASSAQLHQSSWVSIAWYPIYRIPMGNLLRDMSACFLTFHTLSTRGGVSVDQGCPSPVRFSRGATEVIKKRSLGKSFACLVPFGFASYKMRSDLWIGSSSESIHTSLSTIARTWLREQRFTHPDFEFFLGRTV